VPVRFLFVVLSACRLPTPYKAQYCTVEQKSLLFILFISVLSHPFFLVSVMRVLLILLLSQATAFLLSPPSLSSSVITRQQATNLWTATTGTDKVEDAPIPAATGNGIQFDDTNDFDMYENAAVIVNLNARSVTEQCAIIAKQYFKNVYITTSGEEATSAVKEILASSDNQIKSKCQLLIPIGGDGTLTSCINDCVETLQQQHKLEQGSGSDLDLDVHSAMKQLPIIGYIPLGTGNGVGSAVGCHVQGFLRRTRHKNLAKVFQELKSFSETLTTSSSSKDDPRSASSDADVELIDLPMLHITNTKSNINNKLDRLCFFAGVGFDSMMLDDFKSIKQWSRRTNIFPQFLSSVSGYCVALIVKTLPKAIWRGQHNIHVKVTTDDASTLWIDHRRGDYVLPVTREDDGATANDRSKRAVTLFEGSTGILAAGTAPYYGGSLRLFPFARLTINKMHLRIGRIHPVTGFLNMSGIFAGSYRDKSPDGFGCLDFLTDDVTVELRKEFPFQHSGESVGNVDRFRMQVAPTPVQFVSLLKQR
jgi:diacylglycerol kinase family enzyme